MYLDDWGFVRTPESVPGGSALPFWATFVAKPKYGSMHFFCPPRFTVRPKGPRGTIFSKPAKSITLFKTLASPVGELDCHRMFVAIFRPGQERGHSTTAAPGRKPWGKETRHLRCMHHGGLRVRTMAGGERDHHRARAEDAPDGTRTRHSIAKEARRGLPAQKARHLETLELDSFDGPPTLGGGRFSATTTTRTAALVALSV